MGCPRESSRELLSKKIAPLGYAQAYGLALPLHLHAQNILPKFPESPDDLARVSGNVLSKEQLSGNHLF